MERRFTATVVVVGWGVVNMALAGTLLGFSVGDRGGMFPVVVYAAAVVLIFGIALGVWLARRRGPWLYRLRIRHHPGAAVLFAAAVALIWLGLPFGSWVSMLAALPLAAAIMLEIAARRNGISR